MTKEDEVGREAIDFEVAANRGVALVRLLLSLVCLFASAVLLFNGWSGAVPPQFEGMPHQFWGTLGMLMFGFSSYHSGRLLIDRRPRLEISSEGILNRTLWSASALVPWSEIVEIRDTAWPGVREVVMRDPTAWAAAQPRSVRAWSRYTRLLGFGAAPLNLWALDEVWAHIDTRLQGASDHLEFEAYRELTATRPGTSSRR